MTIERAAEVISVDDLAQEIRRVDGDHSRGAASLAEALMPFIAALEGKLERAREGLEQIDQWSEAYPLDIFPEPDFKLARAALEGAGLTLDAVSASNIRHVVTGVGGIARTTLASIEDKEDKN
jgi:hypothetical protein